jgi:hypothetical protein
MRIMLVAIAMLAVVAAPARAQSGRWGGELVLASQLVDQGLAITPATAVLQGAVSWNAPAGWSLGLAGAVEARSPGDPVLLLASASRSWRFGNDWLAQAGLHHYDYRSGAPAAIPDRTSATVSFLYRDALAVGVAAIHARGAPRQHLLGAADVQASLPLAARWSLVAGAGVAQAAVGARNPPPHPGYGLGHAPTYGDYGSRVRWYRFASLGLSWSDGPFRLRLDRHANSLGGRPAYGARTPPRWVATASWNF